MPVYFESAEQPSTQDLADLEKIYLDAPDWLITPFTNAINKPSAGYYLTYVCAH